MAKPGTLKTLLNNVAIGPVETGTVNFLALRTVINGIISHLGIEDKPASFSPDSQGALVKFDAQGRPVPPAPAPAPPGSAALRTPPQQKLKQAKDAKQEIPGKPTPSPQAPVAATGSVAKQPQQGPLGPPSTQASSAAVAKQPQAALSGAPSTQASPAAVAKQPQVAPSGAPSTQASLDGVSKQPQPAPSGAPSPQASLDGVAKRPQPAPSGVPSAQGSLVGVAKQPQPATSGVSSTQAFLDGVAKQPQAAAAPSGQAQGAETTSVSKQLQVSAQEVVPSGGPFMQAAESQAGFTKPEVPEIASDFANKFSDFVPARINLEPLAAGQSDINVDELNETIANLQNKMSKLEAFVQEMHNMDAIAVTPRSTATTSEHGRRKTTNVTGSERITDVFKMIQIKERLATVEDMLEKVRLCCLVPQVTL